MKILSLFTACLVTTLSAQRGPRPNEIDESPAELGSSGFVWYPILEDGLAEAKRSNRPIFFMAAASQCGGISGVFWPGYTKTAYREYTQKEVIEASRDFVCVRIDSYESEAAQKIVRSYLNGRFENTAFCLLSPDGKTRLTRSGRGPGQVFGENFAASLNDISTKYRSKDKGAPVPDFPNFKLSLNVSSADQRLLVLVTGNEKELKAARKHLQPLAEHPDVIGRFHYDFESDEKSWSKALSKSKSGAQIMVVSADAYGQKGEVIKSFPLNSNLGDLKKALLKANEAYAKNTTKKNYGDHITSGRRKGITWKMPVEYGEDRDGDGKIDHRGPPNRRGPQKK